MRRGVVCFVFLLGWLVPASAQSWKRCLPTDVRADEVASVRQSASGGAAGRVTVAQKLRQLKARCRAGKLSDARGRPIRFYRLTGCWGYPPPDYQEILRRQQQELDALRRRYTVVEITCNPSGVPIP